MGEVRFIYVFLTSFFFNQILKYVGGINQRAVAAVLTAALCRVVLFVYLCSCLLARWNQSAGCCLPSKVRSLRPCLDVNDALGEFSRGGGCCYPLPSCIMRCVCLCVCRQWSVGDPCACLEHNDEWDYFFAIWQMYTHSYAPYTILHASVHADLAFCVLLEVSFAASTLLFFFH